MTTFLDDILKAKGYETIPAPLWKLKLNEEEYDKLKEFLVNEFSYEASFDNCPREAALFYAEWWKRNNGEGIDEPFLALGIGSNQDACDNLFLNAKRIFDPRDRVAYIPGAKLVISNKGREFKYSLFYQGGFPMGRVCAGIRNGRKWNSFIQKFIQNNVDFEDMPGAIIARKALREYKDVLVSAGREHKPEGMPFSCNANHDWYLKVINDIKEIDKQRELRPFHIKWYYKRNPNDFSIKCNVLGPSVLSPSYVALHKELEAFDSLPIQLFVGDEHVSTLIEYQKEQTSDGICFSSYYDVNQTFDYDGHSKISLRIPGIDKPLIVSDVDMNVPRCFFWTSGERYEMGAKIGERASVIVFNKDWTLEKSRGSHTVLPCEFNGVPYTIVTIRDNEDNLEFLLRNIITGEPKKFSSDYTPAWTEVKILKKYSEYVVEDLVDFSDPDQHQVLYFKSEDENGKLATSDQVVFRSNKDQQWKEDVLFGKVDCTVRGFNDFCAPENGIYSVGPNFKVKSIRNFPNECHYRVSWDKGDVFPDGADITPTEDGLWIFKKDEYEDVIPFRCIPFNHEEQAFTIRIKAIYKDFAIFSPSGEKVKRYETIPWDDINSYRYRVNGETILPVRATGMTSYQLSINSDNNNYFGVPVEGPLGLLIKPEVLKKCEWRANIGYDFAIRYCDFTLKRCPIKLDYDPDDNALIPSLSAKGVASDPSLADWEENQSRIVTTFKGHLLFLDMNGNLIHEIARNEDGTYHLPEFHEKVFVVCNQRGYVKPFIFENGIMMPVSSLSDGEDSFQNIALDHINWEYAGRFLDTGLRYGIPLQNLPWISEIIKSPALVLALYSRLIIISGNNPLKLIEVKNKMAAAMNAGQIRISDMGEEAMNNLVSACPEGIFDKEYQNWLTMYGYTSKSQQTWAEFIYYAAAKVQSLILNRI